MTEIDVRKAALAAATLKWDTCDEVTSSSSFVAGARWAVEQLPSRDEIAKRVALGLDGTKKLSDWSEDYQDEMREAADAVLDLIRERYEEKQ